VFRLSEQRGKVVVVNFCASWAAPCLDEVSLVGEYWYDTRDRGVVVIGVAYLDSEQAWLVLMEAGASIIPPGWT